MLQPDLAERVAQINGNTMVSFATLVAIIGLVVKMTRSQTSIEFKLDALKDTPKRLGKVEDTLMLFEEDINNLWANQRGGKPEQTRRERFRPNRED